MSKRILQYSTQLLIFALLACWDRPAAGQDKKGDLAKEFGWDLSYAKLLEKNKVKPSDFPRKWLKGTDRSFTSGILAKSPGERIVAALLIEHPAFHAGEHSVIWLFRTEKRAFAAVMVNKGAVEVINGEVSAKAFDDAFKTISSWEQAKPMPPIKVENEDQRESLSGYIGFLNLYDRKGVRQMLLTLRDFYVDCEPGRLTILEPLLKSPE